MSRLLASLERCAHDTPQRPLLHGDSAAWSCARAWAEVQGFADQLDGRCLGVLLDNGPAWAFADLAALRAGICCVPLPAFFSPGQLSHVLADAGIDRLLVADPEQGEALLGPASVRQVELAGVELYLFSIPGQAPRVPDGIAKVTYTSGTTGEPKGVCLRLEAVEQVAASLVSASQAGPSDHAMSLTPLSTLLENIAGIYAPILSGAQSSLPSMARVGLKGSSALDLRQMMATLDAVRPTTIVLAPQMLQGLVEAAEAGLKPPGSLRFIAVGGAPVSVSLLERARDQGLPVYEGYGLSEAASVVTLNTPGAVRIGSVGRVLQHSRVRIAEDGEILVSGGLFDGYLGADCGRGATELHTGDLGYLDDDGYLHLRGKKKSIYTTAFGRNVAPEWVERELLTHDAVGQVAVFGEGRPFSTAIIVPRGGSGREQIQKAVDVANARLPDYARVGQFIVAREAFTTGNGQLTGTGRPRRQNIQQRYRTDLAGIYGDEAHELL